MDIFIVSVLHLSGVARVDHRDLNFLTLIFCELFHGIILGRHDLCRQLHGRGHLWISTLPGVTILLTFVHLVNLLYILLCFHISVSRTNME
jgi:hypothetical protein